MPKQETEEYLQEDIPLNKLILMGTLVIGGAFCFFQLASCTITVIHTPAYVQALQACNEIGVVPITISEKVGTKDITIVKTSEVLAAIAQCNDVVKSNFAGKVIENTGR